MGDKFLDYMFGPNREPCLHGSGTGQLNVAVRLWNRLPNHYLVP